MVDPSAVERPLFDRLEELGIESQTARHAPVRTVAEAKELRGELTGAHIKNLLLRDKKRTLWLVTALEDKAIDLKVLRVALEARGNLSFASAALLGEALGVEPGAVTPFAVLNDRAGCVQLVLDRDILACGTVNAHPLHNCATTNLRVEDLVRFVEACDHPPRWIDV